MARGEGTLTFTGNWTDDLDMSTVVNAAADWLDEHSDSSVPYEAIRAAIHRAAAEYHDRGF